MTARLRAGMTESGRARLLLAAGAIAVLGSTACFVRTGMAPADRLEDAAAVLEENGATTARRASARSGRSTTEVASDALGAASRSPSVIRGHVRTESGQPLAGVRIEIQAPSAATGPIVPGDVHWRRVTAKDVSLANGAFEVDRAEIEPPFRIVATAPFLANPVDVWIRGGEREIELRFPDPVRTRLRVRDERGRPVSSPTLTLSYFDRPWTSTPIPLDAAGEAAFEWAPRNGGDRVAIRALDRGSRREILSIDPSGADRVHEMTLRDGGTLIIRVREAATGRAVGGACVEVHDIDAVADLLQHHRNSLCAEGVTAALDGALRFDCLPRHSDSISFGAPSVPIRESFEIRVDAHGFAQARRELPTELDGSLRELIIELEPVLPILGRLVDEDGDPVTGTLQLSTPAAMVPSEFDTDPDGRFRFQGYSAGAYATGSLQLDARGRDARGHPVQGSFTWEEGAVPVDGDLGTLRCRRTIPPEVRIRTYDYTVTDRTGRPLPDAWIAALGVRRFADHDGRVRCEVELSDSSARLSVHVGCDGYRSKPVAGTFDVGGSSPITLERVRDVRLLVVDRDDRPVAGARLLFQGADGPAIPPGRFPSDRADDEGRLTVRGIVTEPALVDIVVPGRGAPSERPTLTIPAEVTENVLRLPIVFRGVAPYSVAVVSDPPQHESFLQASLVSVDPRDEKPIVLPLRFERGHFRVGDVAGGEYELRIGTVTSCLYTERVTIEPGRPEVDRPALVVTIPGY